LSYDSAQREAFTKALRAAGHDCSVYSVKPRKGAEPDWNLDLVELSKWLKTLPKPVGVLAWNASSSREVVYACQLADLLVPEEVAVLSGSDDDMLCECVHPAISGIMAAAESIGQLAAELLDQLMTGRRRKGKSLLIAPQRITARQSTDTLAIQDPALVKALSFIRQNAAQPIQVNDVAKHAGVSRRILELRFMQHLKRSPAAEIRRSHLERAKRLLAETELTIPDVAQAAGFGSPEYLAYAFKQGTGVSPLQFRKSFPKR
jgi:LacI family transcriptional regulator